MIVSGCSAIFLRKEKCLRSLHNREYFVHLRLYDRIEKKDDQVIDYQQLMFSCMYALEKAIERVRNYRLPLINLCRRCRQPA